MKEEIGTMFRVDKTPAKTSRKCRMTREIKVPYGVHYLVRWYVKEMGFHKVQ